MNLSPAELVTKGYELFDKLDHKELIPFVRKYMKKRTLYSSFYLLANVLIALTIILLFIFQTNAEVTFGDGIVYLSYGFALAFLLIPIHEYIHVLAYRSQGAKNTSYDANLKKFYFMAIADKFVADRKEFTMVALAPFVTISAILILTLLFTNDHWTYTVLGVLLTHTAFCSGDFGLLSYFEFHKGKNVVTYDDKENGISYFFIKRGK